MKPLLYYRLKGKLQPIAAEWDKLSPTKQKAVKFAHKYINKEPLRMKDGQFSNEYRLAAGGESINERFRCAAPMEIDLQIADMVADHVTQKPMILYRGVCVNALRTMRANAKHVHGVDLIDKGFLFTSLVKGHELAGQQHLRIYVPTGTQAIYLGHVVADHQKLFEVVLQRETKLKIHSIDDEYINCIVVK